MVYEQALPHIYHILNFPLHQTSDFQSEVGGGGADPPWCHRVIAGGYSV